MTRKVTAKKKTSEPEVEVCWKRLCFGRGGQTFVSCQLLAGHKGYHVYDSKGHSSMNGTHPHHARPAYCQIKWKELVK